MISGLSPTFARGGLSDGFTINASGLTPQSSYDIKVSTNSVNLGFTGDCIDKEEIIQFTAADASTSYGIGKTLYTCGPVVGWVSAELRRGAVGRQVDGLGR